MSYAVLVRFSLAKYSVDSVMDSAQIDNVCKYIGVKTIKKQKNFFVLFRDPLGSNLWTFAKSFLQLQPDMSLLRTAQLM